MDINARKSLYGISQKGFKPLVCNVSSLPCNSEIKELMDVLVTVEDGLVKFPMDLLSRPDLSPAVLNFVRGVFKELPPDTNVIPDELSESDAYLLDVIPTKYDKYFAPYQPQIDKIKKYLKD